MRKTSSSTAGFPAPFLVGCVAFLSRAGALGPDPGDADGKSWRVEPRWPETFAATPADLALAFVGTTEAAIWGSPLGTLALLERARLAGDASPSITRLAEIGRAWLGERDDVYLQFEESQFRPLGVAASLRTLRAIGLVSYDRREGALRVTATTPTAPPPRPFRCTVLPTFEIWVAEDADPVGTAELGRIADLEATDRVARFTLTATSVARAAREPGGAAAAIERLAACAEHGLPENVRSTLEGWARRAHLMRAYRGAFIATATDEQATFVRGRAGVIGEIAPGIFHVDSEALQEVLRAAEKAGHLLAPVVRDGRPSLRREAYVDSLGLTDRAREVRGRLAGWAKPRPAKPPPKRTGPTRQQPAFAATDPASTDFDELNPMPRWELRRDWPCVGAAVKGFGPIQDLALRLSDERLDEFEDLESPEAIRGAITRCALEWMSLDIEESARPAPVAPPPAPRAAPAPPQPRAAAAAVGATWITPTPGALVEMLTGAAQARQPMDIVYVNAAGLRTERRIVPVEIVRTGRRDWLDATLVAGGATNRFEVDRIAAVRRAEA